MLINYEAGVTDSGYRALGPAQVGDTLTGITPEAWDNRTHMHAGTHTPNSNENPRLYCNAVGGYGLPMGRDHPRWLRNKIADLCCWGLLRSSGKGPQSCYGAI